MFDIGFAELLLIAVVGLLVIGPERLPGTIRTISLWLGRFRRSFNEIRSEIEREVGADEIRRQLHNEQVMASLKESQQGIEQMAQSTEQALRSIGDTPADNDIDHDASSDHHLTAEQSAEADTEPPPAPPQGDDQDKP